MYNIAQGDFALLEGEIPMLSIDAVSSASTRPIVSVVSREVLHTGPVVKMKVPKGAVTGMYPKDDEDIPFLKFCHFVPGGCVNFFVHTDDFNLCGKLVTAAASVAKKTLEDGREFLYVDLVPVDADTPATHRIAVMNANHGSWDAKDHQVFETPRPLKGVIIFTSPDAKVMATGDTVRLPEVERKAGSGDTQLNRLLEDGWTIESQDSATVHLFKMKGDKRKTMVHHRPKSR